MAFACGTTYTPEKKKETMADMNFQNVMFDLTALADISLPETTVIQDSHELAAINKAIMEENTMVEEIDDAKIGSDSTKKPQSYLNSIKSGAIKYQKRLTKDIRQVYFDPLHGKADIDNSIETCRELNKLKNNIHNLQRTT